MSALLQVEIKRLLARRLVRVLVLIAVVGIVIAGVTVLFKSHRDLRGPSTEARIIHQGSHDVVECTNGNLGAISGRPPKGMTPEEFCNSTGFGPQDSRFHLTTLQDVWLGVGGQLLIVAWLIAASFIGAEWHAGTVTTQLTWEPRRVRVFIAKLLACALLVFVGTIVLELLLGAALWPAAALRGTTAGVDGAWVSESVRLLGRAGVACVFGALLGYALGSAGRNTAASLGVGFVYLVVVESLVRGFKPRWAPWLIGDNVVNFLGGESHQILDRSPGASAATLALYCAIALLAALALFKRRDVT